MTDHNKTLKNMIVTAASNPKGYRNLLGVKKRVVLLFMICVALMINVIQVVIPVGTFMASIGGPKHFIQETLPAFEYENGKFHIDQRVDINQDIIRIVADSDVKEFTEKDVDQDKLLEVLVSESNIIMVNVINGQNFERSFDQIGKDYHFTNENLVEMLPYFYGSMAFGAFIANFYIIGQYLYNALFLAVCGIIATMRTPGRLRFGQMYVFALMARMVPALIQALVYTSAIPILNNMIVSFALTVAEFAILWFAIKDA